MSFAERGRGPGMGTGTEVVDVADTEVEDCAAWIFFSERVEYIAAVSPAPVAALTAAIIAIVVFDIVRVCGRPREVFIVLKAERAYDHDRDIDAREGSVVVVLVMLMC
jgi:hypothetical protein